MNGGVYGSDDQGSTAMAAMSGVGRILRQISLRSCTVLYSTPPALVLIPHPGRPSVNRSITHLHPAQPIPPTGSIVTRVVRKRPGEVPTHKPVTPHRCVLNTLTVQPCPNPPHPSQHMLVMVRLHTRVLSFLAAP